MDYNTFEQNLWHGAGQGTANAALWYITLLDVLVDAYYDHIQPSTLQDPTRNIEVIQSIKAFTDNVAMSASMLTNSLQDLIRTAQTQLCWWDMLIKVTGSELNPSKCCGTISTWQPDKFGILQQVHPNPNEIRLTLSDMDPKDQIPILPTVT